MKKLSINSTLNKAICVAASNISFTKYSNSKQTNLRNTLKTLWHSCRFLTARSGIIIDIYVYKSNSIRQLKFVYMYNGKMAKQIPSSLKIRLIFS